MKHSVIPALGAALLTAAMCQTALAVQDEDLGFDDTEDLYQVCSVPPEAAEYIPSSFACRGFIEGAVQYHDAVTNRKNLKRLICYPSAATIEDGRAAFVDWAEKNRGNQERMSEIAVVGLVRALAETYPCE